MRITVRLSDDLREAAKRRAAEEGTTLTSLIETSSASVWLDGPASWRPTATRC